MSVLPRSCTAATAAAGGGAGTAAAPQNRSAFVFPPPGIARQDWKIVRALGEFVGVTLPYSDDEEMEDRVNTLAPLTLNMDEVSQSEVRRERTYR